MYNSRYTKRSPSISTTTSSQKNPTNRLKSPITSDYEYLGRLVTRERPIIRQSNSIQRNTVFSSNAYKYQQSEGSEQQEIYEQIPANSSGDDADDDLEDPNRPLGVIKISDRHFREIYRLPTPPPKVKRVYHRIRSPEPKIIERVYVRRPPPQIIENIIEVPPEKVKIIKREKFLDQSKPIIRSKLVHLKSDDYQGEYGYEQQDPYVPSNQSSQQQIFIPNEQYTQQRTTTSPESTTALVYPPQSNMRTVGYIKSTVPPHIMLQSQQNSIQQTTQPTLLNPSSQQNTTYQMLQPADSPYNPPVPTSQTTNYQLLQSTPYTPAPASAQTNYQMVQPTTYTQPQPNYQMIQPQPNYQMIQPQPNYQMVQPQLNYQMVQPTTYTQPQPTPYVYPSIPNTYGYTKN